MSWFRFGRDSGQVRQLRADLARLGDDYHALRRQLGEAVQRAAQAERVSEQLAADLSACNRVRLDEQVRRVAAEDAAADLGNRMRRALVILAQPGVPAPDAVADALRVLEGGGDG